MAKGFKLGDHQFLTPAEPSSIDRLDAPKRQIKGAPPPACLEGLVREATEASPAALDLLEGACCGHGEPTLTAFDVVIDGVDVLEVSVIIDREDKKLKRNFPAVVVRPPGTTAWTPIFRREWEDRQETLRGVAFTPLSAQEQGAVSKDVKLARVAIGFEYPCDAESRDDACWVEVHILEEGVDEVGTLASAELA